jgi:hypothetical protein
VKVSTMLRDICPRCPATSHSGSPGNRTLNLRIKSLIRCWPLSCGFGRKQLLTCGLLFRLVPTVHGLFWLARGVFVGSDDAPRKATLPGGLRLTLVQPLAAAILGTRVND